MKLIDADKLKTELDAWARIIQNPDHYMRADALHIIDTAPTIDAVPVVRCRECKSHGTLKSGELFCGKIKTGIYGYYHTVKADDYCSYGERKDCKHYNTIGCSKGIRHNCSWMEKRIPKQTKQEVKEMFEQIIEIVLKLSAIVLTVLLGALAILGIIALLKLLVNFIW